MIALQKRRLLIAGREILPDFGQWPAQSLVVGTATHSIGRPQLHANALLKNLVGP
jgi:hypothetical protein